MGLATTSDLRGCPLVRFSISGDFLWRTAVSLTTELRSGLSRSQEVMYTGLVETASIRDDIFRSTKAPPRTPLGVSAWNWCHFTVPPRPSMSPSIQSGAP